MNWAGLILAVAALGYGVYLILNRKAEGERARRRLDRGGRLSSTPAPPGAPERQAATFGAVFVIVGLVGIVFSLSQTV